MDEQDMRREFGDAFTDWYLAYNRDFQVENSGVIHDMFEAWQAGKRKPKSDKP